MEYQAKELFAKHGVPVTLGKVVENADDAAAAAEELGGKVVVKAQVKTGGRGKAGGVKLAADPQEHVCPTGPRPMLQSGLDDDVRAVAHRCKRLVERAGRTRNLDDALAGSRKSPHVLLLVR